MRRAFEQGVVSFGRVEAGFAEYRQADEGSRRCGEDEQECDVVEPFYA